MGIKVHEFHKSKEVKVEKEELSEEIFLMYNEYYQQHMKKDIHIARRLIAGVRQNGRLNLEAFTRFYAIFVNKIATLGEKIKFLVYFFIPQGQ